MRMSESTAQIDVMLSEYRALCFHYAQAKSAAEFPERWKAIEDYRKKILEVCNQLTCPKQVTLW